MVSDFRKKKLLHCFTTLLDVDRSGSVDEKDFNAALEKAAKVRGWSTSAPQYQAAQENLKKIWDSLKKRADANGDGTVSGDEWVALCDEYVNKPAGAEDWQTVYAKYVFQLQDSSNDGAIDAEEFSGVLSSYGLNKDECKKAFEKMSKGKSTVSWDEFQNLWKEYFISEDVNAPGNFIFGKTSF